MRLQVLGTARPVILTFVIPRTGADDWQITNRWPERYAWNRPGRRTELRMKVAWLIRAHTHKQLSPPLLRYAKFPAVFNLTMYSIAEAAPIASQLTSFLLN